MRYIEAPAAYRREHGDRTLFLAGGITGCVDWQAEARERLGLEGNHIVVFNPRRMNFDVADQDAAPAQIAWEVTHLRQTDVTLFWFPVCDPRVTVQPIALFELGMALGEASCRDRRLAVGVDRDYPRYLDVVEQCWHTRPRMTVHAKLEDVIVAALAELDEMENL